MPRKVFHDAGHNDAVPDSTYFAWVELAVQHLGSACTDIEGVSTPSELPFVRVGMHLGIHSFNARAVNATSKWCVGAVTRRSKDVQLHGVEALARLGSVQLGLQEGLHSVREGEAHGQSDWREVWEGWETKRYVHPLTHLGENFLVTTLWLLSLLRDPYCCRYRRNSPLGFLSAQFSCEDHMSPLQVLPPRGPTVSGPFYRLE